MGLRKHVKADTPLQIILMVFFLNDSNFARAGYTVLFSNSVEMVAGHLFRGHVYLYWLLFIGVLLLFVCLKIYKCQPDAKCDTEGKLHFFRGFSH